VESGFSELLRLLNDAIMSVRLVGCSATSRSFQCDASRPIRQPILSRTMMISPDIARARLASQRITDPLDDPARVVAWMGAVQAQDYLGALWAVGARTRGATEASVERAVRERAIVRTWPMRGTLHFVAAADVRWMLALLAPRAVARSAGRMRELEVDAPLIARAKRLLVGALEGGGELTRGELYALLEGEGTATGGQRGHYLLWHAAHDGTICFAARRGKEHTFALLDEWVPAAPPLPRDEALAELAARYFTGHGPATVADFVWWSGMTVADAKRAIAGAGARLTGETVDGSAYWRSPDATEHDASAAYLLPAFDEYLVGYRERGAVLDPAHARRINAGGGLLAPVMVAGGTVAGVWQRTLRKGSAVVHAAPFDGGDASEFEGAAAEYGRFLGVPVELRTGG
jgi:hypothetical protein